MGSTTREQRKWDSFGEWHKSNSVKKKKCWWVLFGPNAGFLYYYYYHHHCYFIINHYFLFLFCYYYTIIIRMILVIMNSEQRFCSVHQIRITFFVQYFSLLKIFHFQLQVFKPAPGKTWNIHEECGVSLKPLR